MRTSHVDDNDSSGRDWEASLIESGIHMTSMLKMQLLFILSMSSEGKVSSVSEGCEQWQESSEGQLHDKGRTGRCRYIWARGADQLQKGLKDRSSQRGWCVSASDKVVPATDLSLKVDPIPATQ